MVYVSARLKDVVSSAAQLHGLNQPAVNVNIANIPMPTEEERAGIRALDAKLDAFAKLIKEKANVSDTPGGCSSHRNQIDATFIFRRRT